VGNTTAEHNGLLTELGLLAGARFTDEARAIEDAFWVRRKPEMATETLRAVYMRQPTIQILMQGLQGAGSIPVEGAMHLLQRHHAASADNLTEFRALLDMLNPFELLAYSRKLQTVRAVTGREDQPESPEVRIVQPDRPYTNERQLRETLRECREYIWWVERSFPRRGLDLIQDVVERGRIQDIRVLSGQLDAPDKTARAFDRFRTEMATLGISAGWRIHDQPPFHDRFVITKGRIWNVPPVNTLLKGDYSEISHTKVEPPFATWWSEAHDLRGN